MWLQDSPCQNICDTRHGLKSVKKFQSQTGNLICIWTHKLQRLLSRHSFYSKINIRKPTNFLLYQSCVFWILVPFLMYCIMYILFSFFHLIPSYICHYYNYDYSKQETWGPPFQQTTLQTLPNVARKSNLLYSFRSFETRSKQKFGSCNWM